MEPNSQDNISSIIYPHDEHSRESDQDAEMTVSNGEFLALAYRSSSEVEINKALSKVGVNKNYQNENGDTALHLAVRSKNDSTVDSLIKLGADSGICNKKGKTPLELAQERLENNPNDVRLQSIISHLNKANPGSSTTTNVSNIGNEPDSDNSTIVHSNSTEIREKRKNEYTYGNTPKKPKMDQTNEIIAVSGTKLSLHGTIYQSKLLALFVKRALDNNYEFLLATEMDEAEKFDDVVLKYKTSTTSDQWTYRFMQAKHKYDPGKNKISITELKSTSNDKDFSLQKYFISFCRIKSKQLFKDAEFNDFTIVTNTDFDFIKSTYITKNIDANEFKRWKNYFVEMKETDTSNDPILKVDNQKYTKIKPKQFKFNENAQTDLIELFKLNLLISALKSPEISKRPNIAYKLKMINNQSQYRRLTEQFSKAKCEQDKIILEFNGKKRKTYILQMATKFVKFFDGFFVEDTGEQAIVSIRNKGRTTVNRIPERERFLDTALKKEIEHLQTAKVKDSSTYLKCMESICSHIENILDAVENKLNEDKENWEKFNDLNSSEFEQLESEKKNLNCDESQLIKLKKEISASTDLQSIKTQIQNATFKIRVSKDIFKKILDETDSVEMKQNLNKRLDKFICDISIIKVALNGDTFNNHVKDFIKEFRIITEYPNENDLSEIIRDEIGKEFSLINADLVSDSYERKLIEFLKEYNHGKGRYLSGDEGRAFFEQMRQQIDSLISIGLCKAHTEKLDGYGISFRRKLRGLDEFLSSNSRVLHVSSDLTRLSAIKAYRDLSKFKMNDSYMFKEDNSYIFIPLEAILGKPKTQEFILSAFETKNQSNGRSAYDLCVIECTCQQNIDNFESLLLDLCNDLLNILCNTTSKKIILIAQNDDELPKMFRTEYEQRSLNSEHQMLLELYKQVEDTTSFENLDDPSQDIVLGRKIIFQGQDQTIPFNKLIDKRSACRVIDPKNLLKLIERDVIQIGDKKVFFSIGYVEDYYIDRYFNREQNSTDRSNGWSENELIIGAKSKVILLANDAGMGKSTVLASIAKKIHSLSEYKWIIRINLNDYGTNSRVKSLSKVKFKSHETGKCIDFVSKMVIRGNEDINANLKLQRSLFRIGLEKPNDNNLASNWKRPQIILFLDGFDEITPGNRKNTTTLINALAATNVSQLWVTTRTHETSDLENELASSVQPKNEPLSSVYYLQPLNENEQKQLVNNFWMWHIRCFKYASGDVRERKYKEIINYLKSIKNSLGINCTKSICDIIKNFPLTDADNEERYTELKCAIKKLSFAEYVDELLSNWNKGALAKDKHFHSNPLNLKMLVEVVFAEKQLNIITNFRPLFIYEKFVEKQFKIYYEKLKKKRGNQGVEEENARGVTFWNSVHNTLAVNSLFPEKTQLPNLMPSDKLNKLKEEIKDDKGEGEGRGEEVSRFGLLAIRPDRLEFIHHSFAEYFFSGYLINYFNYDQVQMIFVENILLENTYGMVRQFFNDQLKKPNIVIELNKVAKELIYRNLQNNFDTNVLKIVAEEEHSEIFSLLMKCIEINDNVSTTLKRQFNLNDKDKITIEVVQQFLKPN